jgi:hypothetical protein
VSTQVAGSTDVSVTTPDVFPTLWTKIDSYIDGDEIFSSEEVYVELQKKADELHDWLKDRKHMLVPLSEEVKLIAVDLLREYPRFSRYASRSFQGRPICYRNCNRPGCRRRYWRASDGQDE